MAGIEPASKNPFLQPSTCLFYRLRFPYTNADKQASEFSILSPWQCRGTHLLTFTAIRRSYSDRGISKQNGSLIKLQKQLYYCQLFLKIRFSKRSRNAACLSQFKIPVETFTSPCIFQGVVTAKMPLHYTKINLKVKNGFEPSYRKTAPLCIMLHHIAVRRSDNT